jgi:hypothetical protein
LSFWESNRSPNRHSRAGGNLTSGAVAGGKLDPRLRGDDEIKKRFRDGRKADTKAEGKPEANLSEIAGAAGNGGLIDKPA